MADKKDDEDDGFVQVATLEELKTKKQMRVSVKDRVIALFYHKAQIYALDYFCYHTGGPLAEGDIEDIGGRLCVVCPWHKHTITLDTGESLYTAIDPKDPSKITPNCSKGIRQRKHYTKQDGGLVSVKLSMAEPEVESDRYFTEPYRVFIQNSLQEVSPEQRRAVTVPIHSSRTPWGLGATSHLPSSSPFRHPLPPGSSPFRHPGVRNRASPHSK